MLFKLFEVLWSLPRDTYKCCHRSFEEQFIDPSEEARLIRFLLNRYEEHGKYARPLHNTTKVQNNAVRVVINYGLRLKHLDLNERQQIMHTSAWLRVVNNLFFCFFFRPVLSGQSLIVKSL